MALILAANGRSELQAYLACSLQNLSNHVHYDCNVAQRIVKKMPKGPQHYYSGTMQGKGSLSLSKFTKLFQEAHQIFPKGKYQHRIRNHIHCIGNKITTSNDVTRTTFISKQIGKQEKHDLFSQDIIYTY